MSQSDYSKMYLVQSYLKDKIIKNGVQLIAFFCFLIIAGSFFLVSRVPPQVPFYYTLPWGEAQLAGKWTLVRFSIFMLIITVISLTASVFFYRKDLLLARIIVWSIVLIVFLSLLGLFTVWTKIGY